MSQRGVLSHVKRFIVGPPIPSELAHHERLSRAAGLAVLSSTASSVAYATEEVLRVLILARCRVAVARDTPIAMSSLRFWRLSCSRTARTISCIPPAAAAPHSRQRTIGENASTDCRGALLIELRAHRRGEHRGRRWPPSRRLPSWHLNRFELALGFVLALMLANLRGVSRIRPYLPVPTISCRQCACARRDRRVARNERHIHAVHAVAPRAVRYAAHALPDTDRLLQRARR